MNKPRTVDQVAKLYDVGRATVYRWVENRLFWTAPTIIPSPSGERDRILFDADKVAEQFQQEIGGSAEADERLAEFLA
jgi:hypothetical protein